MKFIFLLLLVFSSPIFLFGELDWNQFRGATAQGHACTSLPVEWNLDGSNLLWRTKLEGKAWSSPISTGSEIIVSNARVDPARNKLFLEAISINPKTGKRSYLNIIIFREYTEKTVMLVQLLFTTVIESIFILAISELPVWRRMVK